MQGDFPKKVLYPLKEEKKNSKNLIKNSMSFSFIWSPQTHKVFGGYYLNHDNLMIASPEDRKKLIFYFIGSQTPEKLNPSDREIFLREK